MFYGLVFFSPLIKVIIWLHITNIQKWINHVILLQLFGIIECKLQKENTNYVYVLGTILQYYVF